MFVRPRQEGCIVPSKPVEASQEIGDDGRVGVAEVRPCVGIVDRGRDVEDRLGALSMFWGHHILLLRVFDSVAIRGLNRSLIVDSGQKEKHLDVSRCLVSLRLSGPTTLRAQADEDRACSSAWRPGCAD